MYKIETEIFSGPLEKLLELIEIKKLDITKISLAKVTAGFLSFVKELEEEISKGTKEIEKNRKLSLLVDFLYVATRLVLIKAKSLVPQLDIDKDEEVEMEDLQKRLIIYKSLKPMFEDFKTSLNNDDVLFSRKWVARSENIFYPPGEISKSMFGDSIKSLLGSASMFFPEHKKLEQQKISMEKMIDRISKAIKDSVIKFSDIINPESKEESIVAFLAVLHLSRDGLLVAEQILRFGEINIHKTK